MNAAAGLAGLASAAGNALGGAGPAFLRQPPNIAAAAAVARQQVLLPNSMVGVPSTASNGSNQLPFNFPGVSAAQIATAARNAAGGGFGSVGESAGSQRGRRGTRGYAQRFQRRRPGCAVAIFRRWIRRQFGRISCWIRCCQSWRRNREKCKDDSRRFPGCGYFRTRRHVGQNHRMENWYGNFNYCNVVS